MNRIGILAYGSLIEDPGCELERLIIDRIEGVETPFNVEFARRSKTRDGAPTLIPVSEGGSRVCGTILVFKEGVGLEQAKDLLWRRETRNECTNRQYRHPKSPGKNQVVVEEVLEFHGFDTVIYTQIGANIENLNAQELAKLAIDSARASAGEKRRDGISYLISVKRQGISTPLMPAYEEEILRQTNADSLEDALKNARSQTQV